MLLAVGQGVRTSCEVSRTLAVVRIHPQNARREPTAAAHYILSVGELRFEGVTGADGLLVQQVPAESSSGHLTVVDAWEAEIVFRNHDPADSSPGATPRFANLGSADPARADEAVDANEELDGLIAGFQDPVDELDRSGHLDGPTQARLLTRRISDFHLPDTTSRSGTVTASDAERRHALHHPRRGVWELHHHRARRFGELRRGLPGLSEKMLGQQLREMEEDGLVSRVGVCVR